MRYFIKCGMERKLVDSKGRPVPFISIGDNTGYIALDESTQGQLIGELEKCVGRLGVMDATEESVDEAKKKSIEHQSRRFSMKVQLRIDNGRAQRQQAAPAADAGEADPEPAAAPAPKPRRARKERPLPTADLAPQPSAAAVETD